MHIGVIGAGWLGGTVGRQWVKAGHDVLFSSRNPATHAEIARRLGPHASVGTIRQAAGFGEVVLIAVPYSALPDLGRQLKDDLAGKIVLDACNPYPPDPEDFRKAIQEEGVALATARLLPGARVARAFSAVDATSVEESAGGAGPRLGVPIASDDREALSTAEQLVRDAGCEPVVVGGLADARSFQRGGPGFRANTDAGDLRRRLGLDR
ncbi:MAG TPA: NADPH-dependent F420 reductase [Stellaceae bacterium]|nr:NADPH-dependent F420 reductase [Stellaceae bacterium]